MKKNVLVFIMGMAFIAPAISQEFQDVVPDEAETKEELDEICKSVFSGNAFMSSSKEIEDAVDAILETVGIQGIDGANFELKSCDRINNAVAKILKINGEDVRYVLYDPKLLQDIINKTNNVWSAKFILAHEIGHHINGHSMNNGTSNHEYELDADYFAGRALAMMGASEMETLSATSILPERASSTHPSRAERAERAKEGWNSVEKIKTIKVSDEDIDEIGKNMVSQVQKALNESSSYMSVEDFGKNFKVLNLARTKYYKAYTEDIRYLEAICLTGMKDAPKAETAYINYLSIENLDSKERIKQIVSLYVDSNTSKSSFFQNPEVIYQMANAYFNRGNYEKAINYSNQFYQFSNPEKDQQRISEINKLIATSEYKRIMLDDGDSGEDAGDILKRGYAAFENQEFDKAFELLSQGAQAKDAKSQFYLAKLYNFGQGTAQNVEKALDLYFKSSQNGYAEAQYFIGYFYYKTGFGNLLSIDLSKAKYWLTKSSEQGYALATTLLNELNKEITPNDYNTITPVNKETKPATNAESLAIYVSTGDSYFSQELYSDAYENYIEAAKMGNAHSQEKVAWMLYKGKGVKKDKDAAIGWWKKAAAQGNIEAINILTRLGEW